MRQPDRGGARKRLLFVCVENSNRSQMAEAFARMLGGDAFEAWSAGSRPSGVVNPKAIASMAELGHDLAGHRSKPLTALPQGEFEAVISMGCGETCPFVPARRHETWQIPDPRDMDAEGFRAVRDEIRRRVAELLGELRARPSERAR